MCGRHLRAPLAAHDDAAERSRTVMGLPGRRHYRTPRRAAANYRALAVEKLAALGFDIDKIRSDAWLG